MTDFEQEIKRIEPVVRSLSNLALVGKKMMVSGRENFIPSGPNIIVGNHIGTFKDIAILFKIVPRPIFFTANKMLFNRKEFNLLIKKHFRRHLKNFGPAADVLLSPIKSLVINYVSSHIIRVGTIPVDLTGKKRFAMATCQDYLKKGRAIIALQGRGRVMNKSRHPYVDSFRRGVAVMAYNVFQEEGIRVPVTPMAIFGTQIPFFIPAKVKINVGKPMYITDYLAEGFTESVDNFRYALEKRVKELFRETILKMPS